MNLDDLPGDACPICGDSLEGMRTDAIYCSRRCLMRSAIKVQAEQLAAARAGRTCPECGKVFDAPYRSDNIYCSATCGKRGWLRSTLGERDCPTCGKRFVRRTIQQAHCSLGCFHAACRASRPEVVRPFDRTCPACGRAFRVHSVFDRTVHCSRRCAWVTRRERASRAGFCDGG